MWSASTSPYMESIGRSHQLTDRSRWAVDGRPHSRCLYSNAVETTGKPKSRVGRLEMCGDQPARLGQNFLIATNPVQPVHLALATKPGKLPFGVIAMALLCLHDCLFACKFAAHNSRSLPVPKRAERTALVAVALDQAFRLLDQPSVEHRGSALVDALIKSRPWRVQPKPQDAIARQLVAAFLPLLRQWLIRSKRHLDCPNHLRNIVHVDRFRCGAIESSQHAVQISRSALRSDVMKPLATPFFLRRSREEAIDQRPQIQSRTACNDRQTPTFNNAAKRLACLPAVVSCCHWLVRPRNIDHVVGNKLTFLKRRLGRADLHLAIDRNRIAAHNLAVELFRQPQCKRSFAAC